MSSAHPLRRSSPSSNRIRNTSTNNQFVPTMPLPPARNGGL
uniref:Uncharacterized protein n=1 Tax=Homo sapiens TaxID=9606 RepID=V9H032_HUMAN|nr:RAGE-1 ORF2; one of 3 possible coding regions; a peptide derived from this protein is displayed at the cell surface where it is recognized by CTL [Homo sapiens]